MRDPKHRARQLELLSNAADNTRNPVSEATPLGSAPWIARSLLQKAIRRGRTREALAASEHLVSLAPDKFWRRLVVIAFEEIGIADFDLVSLVTSAAAEKSIRMAIGQDLDVARALVFEMCAARKCRVTDDLAVVAEYHGEWDRARSDLGSLSLPELMHVACGQSSLPERALALWYALGSRASQSPRLAATTGDATGVFLYLADTDVPWSVTAVSEAAYKRTREVICPLLLFFSSWIPQAESVPIEHDLPPEEVNCAGVPSWALDGFTRVGRQAIARLLKRECETARWTLQQVPSEQHVQFLSGVLFRIEGGMTANRACWSQATDFRRTADLHCHGPHCADATEILTLMRADLPLLNEERVHVAANNLR